MQPCNLCPEALQYLIFAVYGQLAGNLNGKVGFATDGVIRSDLLDMLFLSQDFETASSAFVSSLIFLAHFLQSCSF
jgi:hypothetical protein